MTAFPLWTLALSVIGMIYAFGWRSGIVTMVIMASALVIGTLIYLGIVEIVK
jgi:hypothetical protein